MNINPMNNGQPAWTMGMHREKTDQNPVDAGDNLENSWVEVNPSGSKDLNNDKPTECAKKGKKAAAGVATAFALGAQKIGLGAKILQHGAALAKYGKIINDLGSLGAYRPVQYLAAQSANKAAAAIVGTTVCGASLG